jgi:pteridine reductase
MPDTQNNVALITGGARRIGAAICRELHRNGCRILIHYHASKQAAGQLADELNALRTHSCATLGANLRKQEDLDNLVKDAYQLWGRLDILINNASTFYPTPVGDITEEQWDDLTETNVKAPLFLSQAAAPYLRRSRGCIINILDIHAERPMRKHVLYSASKSALAAITRSLARELAPDIRVNGVAPGAILWPENDMSEDSKQSILRRIPLQRTGRPEDIATAVRFLALDTPYITGQIINVDGGRSLMI